MHSYERKGTLNFVLLGAKGTGKTVYIYNLNNRAEITALGKETIDYIEHLKHAKENSGKIQATQIDYRELFFEYKDNEYKVDFQIDDYDGNFIETLRTDENSDYKEKLTNYIQEAEGIFVFLAYEPDAPKDRFEKMKVETDTFIERIKEIYGETYKDLPIPIMICVTKWDESPHFKKENELEEAIKYIESNQLLKDIKDKLVSRFKTVEIMPISSEKNHNVLLPIKTSLDYTFNLWEEKIKKLSNKKELFLFLAERIYDLKFYKDGEYVELYNRLEEEFSNEILSKLENIKSISKFNQFYEENEELIEALNNEHKNIIAKKQEELLSKNKTKKFILALSAVAIIGAGGFGFLYYKKIENEKKLYTAIETEYTSKNYPAVIKDAKKYFKNYSNINKEHFKHIKQLEEKSKEEFRVYLNKELDKLSNLTSLVEKYKIVSNLEVQTKEYEVDSAKKEILQNEIKKTLQDKEMYDDTLDKISQLSLDTINKNNVDFILNAITKLNEYDEDKMLRNEFFRKIKTIINASDTTENDMVIQTLLDLASTINLSKEEIDKLNKRLSYLKFQAEINNFLENVKNKDNIFDALEYISINWKDSYGEKAKLALNKIMKEKFSKYVENAFDNFPTKIRNINDYNRAWNIVNNIKKVVKEFKKLPIKIEVSLNESANATLNKYTSMLTPYDNLFKYGIKTSRLILIAPKNNYLGFSPSDDQIAIYIDGKLFYYYKKQSNGAYEKDGKVIMSFNHTVTISRGSYIFKIVEYNIFQHDKIISGRVNISANDLINLFNKNYVVLPISGTNFTIELQR